MRKQLRLVTRLACLFLLVPLQLTDVLLAKEYGAPTLQSGRDRKGEARERQDREAALRNPGLGTPIRKEDQKRIDATLDQMKQDFRRIQIVRNDIVRNLLANKPFDYKVISDEVSEVNKRADRLKTALLSTSTAEKEKAEKTPEEFNPEELKSGLVKLCHLIDSFVENPVLKNPATTDVEELSRAGAELLKIIELSGSIRKNAVRLHNISR